MPNLPPDVLRLAEHLNTYLPLRRGDVRIETDRYVVILSATPGPHGTVVQRLRLQDEDVPAVVAEVRALLRRLKRRAATFEVGPSATPADLSDKLRGLGMIPTAEPVATAMVLDEPPRFDAEPPSDLRVTEVTTLADFQRGEEIFWDGFGFRPEGDTRAIIEQNYHCLKRSPYWLRYLAWQGERAIAAADATVTDSALVLSGGATLPDARSRGAYRALLLARFQEAVRRGIPRLVTQASSMSRPILARLGFREVARIHIFLDEEPESGAGSSTSLPPNPC